MTKSSVERTYSYAGVDMRVFRYEVSDNREGLVVLVVDTEEDFIVWVLLSEGGFQVLVKVRVKPFQRS